MGKVIYNLKAMHSAYTKNMLSDVEKINVFAESILQQRTFDDLLWDITTQVSVLMGLDDCVLYLADNQMLIQAATFGIKNPQTRIIAEPIRIPFGEGIVGAVAATATAEMVTDTRNDARYISDQYDGSSEVSVPIVFENSVIGVLDSEAKRVAAYCQTDLNLLQAFANVAASRIAWMRSEQLRQKEEAEHRTDKLESLGKLAGGVAHDFNNLLTIISLHLVSIVDDDSNAQMKESEEVVLQAIERAVGLTKQLTIFARGGEPQKEEVNIRAILNQSVAFMSTWEGITFSMQINQNLPCAWADPDQLSQVFNNLILNAAHAMNFEGVITISAYVQDGANGRQLLISVQDEGPGIPDEQKRKVFDPYYSTKELGTGLGLATSYWAALRHGGDLTVGDAANGGAHFKLSLPVVRAKVVRSEPQTNITLDTLKVLILDDEPDVALGLKKLLAHAGHIVKTVHSGSLVAATWQQGLEEGKPFDIAILDLVQPKGIGGLEAFKQLKAIDPDATAIVMSGYSDSPVLSEYQNYGFKGRLAKPFRKNKLYFVLHQALFADANERA